ncbi:hypothetical protein [Amycolatopsis sp. BJA-103]|uniref:hypothetical protein n=1 Tax=Amycolatopsis sp. BJA-103 TaxID=1911175 RepID=UPI000C77C18A|nr:hypothetical protein [Amycolatopsis sp. BJA-103]AUI60394.1 hypothetical protein BKN51_20805 [Amycolatopsis sp. BJA-103]PNE16418.1 hypothetical protein B1H26_24430 [Amycolatopsis sp. BJA-103]
MSGKWTKYLALGASFLSAVCLGVYINKLSDIADSWWVLLLGTMTLAMILAVWVRRRRQVAPVVRVVFYVASGMSGVGMILSLLLGPLVLQRAGAIAAASGLLVVGLITQGVDLAARRLTSVALLFLGVSCDVAALQSQDRQSQLLLLAFATVLQFAAWKSRSTEPGGMVPALVVLVLVASFGLPTRPEAPAGAAVVVLACGVAGLTSRHSGDSRLRLLVVIFGFCGAILAYMLVRGQHVVLNTALAGVAVSAVGWAVATRRGRDNLALAALSVFATCTVVVGATIAWSTTLGLGGAYLATAVAVLLNGVLVWLPRLPAVQARWDYFLNGPDDIGDGDGTSASAEPTPAGHVLSAPQEVGASEADGAPEAGGKAGPPRAKSSTGKSWPRRRCRRPGR